LPAALPGIPGDRTAIFGRASGSGTARDKPSEAALALLFHRGFRRFPRRPAWR
jgi:hypothetical protein